MKFLAIFSLFLTSVFGVIYTTINPCEGIPNCIITGTRTFHSYGEPTGSYDDYYDDDDSSSSSSSSSSSGGSSSLDDDDDDSSSSSSSSSSSGGSGSSGRSSSDDDDLDFSSKAASSATRSHFKLSSVSFPSVSLSSISISIPSLSYPTDLPSSDLAKLSSLASVKPTNSAEMSKALNSLKDAMKTATGGGDDSSGSPVVMAPISAVVAAFGAGVFAVLL
ncbi:hypothetical protein TRICI_003556 [Trichomonascus ciferrii]|uniref:Uncharacterized protein n=1 Tax=Trichomonascus ciferrii TaxID=44093 RepID=A0A642V3I4_9ASCO|nr:hypothetical protein TRICI_003556 [Trichomonascus ciferrii]